MEKLLTQRQNYRENMYSIVDLITVSKELPTETVDIRLIDKWYNLGLSGENTDLTDVVDVFNKVISADLKYPIILSHCGGVLDGKHRLTKALLSGKKTIKVKIIPKDMMPIPVE